MKKIGLLLFVIPALSMAEDTRCTMELNDIRIESITTGRTAITGLVAVRGTAFSGSYLPICKLDSNTRTGKISEDIPEGPYREILVGADQCDRWLTAIELALALEMKLALVYDSVVQPDCESLNDEPFPYLLEVHKHEPSN